MLETDKHPGELRGIRSLSPEPDHPDFESPSPPSLWQVAIVIDGVVYTMNRPNRHSDVIAAWCEYTGEKTMMGRDARQGFLTREGEYLTRHEALRRYEALGHKGKWPPRLYSEDLW